MNESNDSIAIKVSKPKAILLTLVPTFILCGAIYYFVKALQLDRQFDKYFLITCTTILITVMSFAMKKGISTIRNIDTGLLLTQNGLKINWGLNQGQLIDWNDITNIKVKIAINEPSKILIIVKNPEKYISQKPGLIRFIQKWNLKIVKTPIVLTTSWYEDEFEQITILLKEKINTVHNNGYK